MAGLIVDGGGGTFGCSKLGRMPSIHNAALFSVLAELTQWKSTDGSSTDEND